MQLRAAHSVQHGWAGDMPRSCNCVALVICTVQDTTLKERLKTSMKCVGDGRGGALLEPLFLSKRY